MITLSPELQTELNYKSRAISEEVAQFQSAYGQEVDLASVIAELTLDLIPRGPLSDEIRKLSQKWGYGRFLEAAKEYVVVP
jgi:hypothetical protein